MTDPVEDILNQMDGEMALMRNALRQAEGSLAQAQQSCHDLLDAMYEPYNAVWAQWGAAHDLRIPATGRTQDVEWVLSYQYAKQKLQSSFRPQPISESQGGITFSLTPVGMVGITWASTSRERIAASRIELRIRWRVETSVTADPEFVAQVIQLTPILRNADVAFIECTASAFYDDLGGRKDVFWMLPPQYRRQSRNELYRKVNDLIVAQVFTIPPLDVLGSAPQPHSVTLWANQLHAAGRSLPKRRQFHSLAGKLDSGKNAGARVKKEIVEPIVKQMVESQGIDLVRQEFHYGYLVTEVHRHEEHSECWVTVEVDVWLVHEHVIRESQVAPAVLRVHASPHGEGPNNVWARYEIEAHNCGPACDRVIREAESRTNDAINDAQYLTLDFVDLSNMCRHAACRPEPFGLYFMLEI